MVSRHADLNENPPLWLTYLNVWSPVVGTVWEGLEGVAFEKKVSHWGGQF